ncbi:MAG: hypothetical protein H0X37_03080 [Herpetosiphonaceae bacterium]|nr:hypothetical protein [Herpetosiphonaceae bacterium]
MPKHARSTLAWSTKWKAYELREGDQASAVLDADAWSRWLDEHGSFSFRGRNGRLSLLKERRKAGLGYWYAYRRQRESVAKRYAGRSGELTFVRLEELAWALEGNGEQVVVPQPAVGEVEDGGHAGLATAEILLVPKLQPPRLHNSLVRRERLLAQLDAGRERKLTLLSAPAGFGKTTLVCQWLAEAAEQDNAPVIAWLALDQGDNDPLRFWRYVITACRTFGPDVGAQSLALLDAPLAIKSPLDMILTVFVNELAQIRCEGILVLEDYHGITTPQIHEAVGLLLDHLPRQLCLLITTRTRPPLALARLAATGELTEIEAPELRFSDAETAAFLRQIIPVPLQPDEIALVESRLEGWAAGLRLLALAVEGRDNASDIDHILENFIAGRRSIGEYFVAEVLHNQPAPFQLFLLQTSFLVRLTTSLCDSVTGRSDSQEVLELLEQANLFIEPLDGSGLWYRYHALFATAMQAEARRRLGEAAMRNILARAGRWYEEHAMLPEAIEAAFVADNSQRAVDLIELVVGPQFSLERPELHGPPEFYTLQSWLTRLPQGVMDERPLFNLALAIAMLFSHIVKMRPATGIVGDEIERLLIKALHGFSVAGETDRLGQVFAFRALLFRERSEIAAAVDCARVALEALPPHELNWRSICVGTLGLGEQGAGHLYRAGARFAEARAMCEHLGNRPFARANAIALSWILLEQNELQRAAPLFRQMLAEARAMGDIEDMANALHGLAEIALCENDLDAAWTKAEDVVDVMRQYPHESAHVDAALILARVEQAHGQSEAALARCAALLVRQERAILPAAMQLVARITFEQARIALATGDLSSAQRWQYTQAPELELPRVQHDRQAILLGRLLMAEGDPEAAVQLLEPLLAAAESDGRGRVALEMRLPLALAFTAIGQPHNARQTLAAALASAQPANAQRVFVAEGEALAALLRATLPTLADKGLLAFAKTVLGGVTAIGGRANIELLSPQERRVLHLVAAGRSNPQIATNLIVSVNTVKVHVKSIYRKLNVNSRLEAASAARELGLL